MTVPDPRTLAATAIHERLRALLLAQFAQEPTDHLAVALAYELASIVATVATTQAEAIEAVMVMAEIQVAQVRRLGVGRPHP